MVTLNNEHRYIASLLDGLAEQADQLLPGRTPDYALTRDIVHYMAHYPDEFHHPREELLFDRLVDRDPESRGHVQQLRDGHREINRRSRELLSELERAAGGRAKADNQKLKYLCDRYIGYYWEHINTEEGKVFPRATAKLRQDDWFAVNSEAKYVDDPLFGTRVRKEYQRLSQYLASRAERLTEDIAVAELFGIEALIEAVAALGTAAGEMRSIMGRRLRNSLSESFEESGERLATRQLGAMAGLPAALFKGLCGHASDGARELVDVARRTRDELAEPFAARFSYLRKLIG
jgi:hemerythrin-like domain-containing protein